METKTPPNTSTANKPVTSTVNGIKTIKTIFEWEAHWPEHRNEAKRHSHSHCLLRIYVDPAANRAAVIASELNSNRQNIGISVDFEGLAQAVVKKFSSDIDIPLSQVFLIKHYGRFSEPRSYENLGMRDRFCKIDLPWNGKELKGNRKETVLRIAQVQDLIGWLHLETVEKVLLELNAASLSEWTAAYVKETQAKQHHERD